MISVCAAIFIALGRRQIFRAAVTRRPDRVSCRYAPWFESNVYALNVILPVLAVAAIAAGRDSGNPAWLFYGGVVLLALTPLFTYAAMRTRRRSMLVFFPGKLILGIPAPGDRSTEIPRDRVEAIRPTTIPNEVGGSSQQVEIVYRRPDSRPGDAHTTETLGPHLSVEPGNLYQALMTWKTGTGDNSDALLDQIERILRHSRGTD
jgi:hypothetical protein